MLINKWIITDRLSIAENAASSSGFCLDVWKHLAAIGTVYRFVQKDLTFTPFAILLSGDMPATFTETDLENTVGLFFQPSYYMVDEKPVVFLKSPTAACMDFLKSLQHNCERQGLKPIVPIEIKNSHPIDGPSFGICTKDGPIDLNAVIRSWVEQCLNNYNPSEIHILVPAAIKNTAVVLNQIQEQEDLLKETATYKVANTLYAKTREIEAYKQQLYLKSLEEKNNRLYLSIQKEGRANALSWYYHEYEVLPLWYKRFGHIIKVLMGKRTLKSLFNDNVKKHND